MDWEERYQTGDMPWDTPEPDERLVDFVQAGRATGRALEVGCGTGTNCVWLARAGLEVLGLDVSPTAIEQAKAKATGLPHCRFETLDFLRDEVAGAPFDFVFDRGFFHVFDSAADRSRFARRVADLLVPRGAWLSLIGSTEGPARDQGPPRRSLCDVANAIEPVLEIVQVTTFDFHADIASQARAWACVARRREVPAQPSTQR
jgi:SAM-dependent methyltransferase